MGSGTKYACPGSRLRSVIDDPLRGCRTHKAVAADGVAAGTLVYHQRTNSAASPPLNSKAIVSRTSIDCFILVPMSAL